MKGGGMQRGHNSGLYQSVLILCHIAKWHIEMFDKQMVTISPLFVFIPYKLQNQKHEKCTGIDIPAQL